MVDGSTPLIQFISVIILTVNRVFSVENIIYLFSMKAQTSFFQM